MFHGVNPPGQPRTARTLAESHADPKNFPEDLPYNNQAGAPMEMPGAGASYQDAAQETAGQQLSPRDAGPSAFSSVSAKPTGTQAAGDGPSPFARIRRG